MRILNFFTESPICDSVNKLLQKVEYPVEHIPALSSLYLVDMYNICTSPTLVFLDDEDKEIGRYSGEAAIDKILSLCRIY